jgi:hypothetical protein
VSPWPFVFAIAALIAIGAVVAYLVLHGIGNGAGKSSSRSGGGTPAGGAIHLKGVTAYDPQGGDGEHNADAYKATDSSPDTYWETQTYYDAPSLAGKRGVGLVLDAGRRVQLHHLGFTTQTPGLTAEILAGDSENGPFPAVVGASQVVSGQHATYTITGGPHEYYVIWITRLGNGYQTARINAVDAN